MFTKTLGKRGLGGGENLKGKWIGEKKSWTEWGLEVEGDEDSLCSSLIGGIESVTLSWLEHDSAWNFQFYGETYVEGDLSLKKSAWKRFT